MRVLLTSVESLKKPKTLTVCAMFMAMSVVLGFYTIQIGDYLKIGFSSLVNESIAYLFGPVIGCFFGAASDIIKYMVRPTGPFFFGFTLNAMLAGLMNGCILYKKPPRIGRIFAAQLIVSLICNILLGTYWLTLLYGKAFLVLLSPRLIKNLVMVPVNTLLLYSILKIMEGTGLEKILNQG